MTEEWQPQGSYEIAGVGTAFTGGWPFEDVPLRESLKDYCGRQLLVGGEVRSIRAIESFARLSGPRHGELISLLFEDDPVKPL